MEPVTYISGLVLTLSLLISSLLMNKNLEFWRIPSLCREKRFNKLCKKWSFNIGQITDLNETIELLSKQIAEIETN